MAQPDESISPSLRRSIGSSRPSPRSERSRRLEMSAASAQRMIGLREDVAACVVAKKPAATEFSTHDSHSAWHFARRPVSSNKSEASL